MVHLLVYQINAVYMFCAIHIKLFFFSYIAIDDNYFKYISNQILCLITLFIHVRFDDVFNVS